MIWLHDVVRRTVGGIILHLTCRLFIFKYRHEQAICDSRIFSLARCHLLVPVNFFSLFLFHCDTEADIGRDEIQVFQQERSSLSQMLRLVPGLFALASGFSHRASLPDEMLWMVLTYKTVLALRKQCTAESQTGRKSFLCDNLSNPRRRDSRETKLAKVRSCCHSTSTVLTYPINSSNHSPV